MKNKFYIKHWLKLKPQYYSGKTDVHYLKIANDIYSSINEHQKLKISEIIDGEDIIDLCCFITCYYEDVISQTNIWKTFKKLHGEAYTKALPFYNLGENYIDEEINLEDVAFLIWYYINTIQGEKLINPYNEFIVEIAKQIMDILDEDYEFAPENITLKKFYEFNSNLVSESDKFYKTREYLQKVFFESYIFYPDIKFRLDQEILTLIDEYTDKEPHVLSGYIRDITEEYTFSKVSSLLALNAKDWTKALLGSSHADYEAISSISPKIKGLFKYRSQSETDVTLEHIASEMLFKMTKKSFDLTDDLHEDHIIYIGLVKYNDEWWFSGNFTALPFDANLILDQKNSLEARSEVSFLEDRQETESILSQQRKAFLDYNKGSFTAFLRSKDLNPFLDGFISFYNNSLKLTDQDRKGAGKRARMEGYFGHENGPKEWDDTEDLYVVFFNPNSGVEFYDDIVNAFPDKRNPFFAKESREDIQHVLMSQVCSTEFTNYFIEHFKDELDYFKIEPFKSYLNDLDFLLKYWKKDHYKTKSTVVITGKTE